VCFIHGYDPCIGHKLPVFRQVGGYHEHATGLVVKLFGVHKADEHLEAAFTDIHYASPEFRGLAFVHGAIEAIQIDFHPEKLALAKLQFIFLKFFPFVVQCRYFFIHQQQAPQ